MTDERWLRISGFSAYEVSDQGQVRSFQNNRWGLTPVPRLLKPQPRTIYRYVRITSDEGRYKERLIHQLVLAAFVGPCPTGQVTRHLNGDGSDNRLANLRYGTHAENSRDTVRHGHNVLASRTHCGHGHPFSGDNLIYRRDNPNYRACRECRLLADRRKRRKEGHAERERAAYLNRVERLVADPSLKPHGRASTYKNWGCRCEACTAAHTAACNAYDATRGVRR